MKVFQKIVFKAKEKLRRQIAQLEEANNAIAISLHKKEATKDIVTYTIDQLATYILDLQNQQKELKKELAPIVNGQ